MKYVVSRTSGWKTGNKKPCEEAVKEELHVCGSFLKMVDYKWVYDKCVITEETKDTIYGYMKEPTECWVVDIPDLEALNAFIKKYGECIIKEGLYKEALFEIEIYDDYRQN